VVGFPESFQQLLEVGGLLAEGAQSHLFFIRVEPMAQVGGTDALAALVRRRAVGKLLVPPDRGQFLLGHSRAFYQ
jgi:hypothetical protein